FLGAVDAVVAAAEFLGTQPYVAPHRIYLGGHSPGGTLTLLTAECSDRFRAVISFGPVEDPAGYGPEFNPFPLNDLKERRLRAPGNWLASIHVPTFVFEGTVEGNLESLQVMARTAQNPKVQFFPVKGANHFNVLAPVNRLIAAKIRADKGASCNLAFTPAEVNKSFAER
ncbi:MAG: alpha/beta hydrolase family protein, partial [Gemmataceae bacterium]